ncbi:MAG: aspartate-semialdehyde dehydrogenase [Elusimicrobia bacterium]|nr:aspartate-semialdehyde dehydrogenase [Candidatus Liberimonas magnetica]
MDKKYKVAVVGATGVVGQEMIKMLEARNFPVDTLRLLASKKSAGKKLKFRGKDIEVKELSKETSKGLDIALFSAGGAVSKEFAPVFAEENCFVIDNSSAWRMEPGIPLVVPEVNSDVLSTGKKIIANPNCSTIQMVVVLKPIHDAVKIKRVIVSTYQAVSGAGRNGIVDLEEQAIAWSRKEAMPAFKKFPYQIAFNVIPQIDVFTENGYTKEEMKMVNETKKIMGDSSINVSATCVRVPVFRAHSESVWIETDKKITPQQATELLLKAPGVEVIDDPKNNKYPMPIDAAHKQVTFVGRLREDISAKNGLTFWVVSDNLLKGAALNAVEIAEALVFKGIV